MKNLFIYMLFANLAIANIPSIVRQKNNIKILTDSNENEKIGYGNWDILTDGENLMIQTFINQNDMVIDAGAHFGDWSECVLNHTKNCCSLHSFEPIPKFYDSLNQKFGKSSKCNNLALGRADNQILMHYYFVESEGCSSLFERKVLNDIPVKKIIVNVTSLDKYCKGNNIKKINYLKIDVEGAELDLILGANELISNKSINFIQFEYGGTYPDANITLKQIYDYLSSKEYSIFRITSEGLIYIPQWRDVLENYDLCNYLAVLND